MTCVTIRSLNYVSNAVPAVFFLMLLCSFTFSSFSQSIYVRASADRSDILIGEPIRLQLEAVIPLNTPSKWFPIDTIPHFEFIERGKIDTVTKADHIQFKQVVTVTSFDSGSWVIPSLPLEINDKFYLTDSLPVSVSFSAFNPSQDYHDIKDILDVDPAERNYITWIIGILTLLAFLALAYYLYRRRKPQQVTAPPPPLLSPIEEALKLLEQLKAENLPEKGEVKLYYTRLTDILRSFITRKLQVTTQQKTSEELILHLKRHELPQDQFLRLAQALRMSDAVKFAKYVPPMSDNNNNFDEIKNSIELLNNTHPSAV